MAEIPQNTVTQQDLEEWYRLQDQLRKLKASELLLRTKIYKGLFIDPKEGTNKVPLANGYMLNAKRTINRDVDQAALQAAMAIDPGTHMSRLSSHGIHVEQLIKWLPELNVKIYRTLTAEQQQIFDEVLIIKDGSPQLEIVLPAAEKKKQEAAAAQAAQPDQSMSNPDQ